MLGGQVSKAFATPSWDILQRGHRWKWTHAKQVNCRTYVRKKQLAKTRAELHTCIANTGIEWLFPLLFQLYISLLYFTGLHSTPFLYVFIVWGSARARALQVACVRIYGQIIMWQPKFLSSMGLPNFLRYGTFGVLGSFSIRTRNLGKLYFLINETISISFLFSYNSVSLQF